MAGVIVHYAPCDRVGGWARALVASVEPDEPTRAVADNGWESRRYDPAQLRIEKGFEGGGRWRRLADIAAKLLDAWEKGEGPDDPLHEFDLPQLKEIAKDFGLPVRRGAQDNEVKNLILDQRRKPGHRPGLPADTPAKKTAAKAPAKKAPARKATPGTPKRAAALPAKQHESLQAIAGAYAQGFVDTQALGIPTATVAALVRGGFIQRVSSVRTFHAAMLTDKGHEYLDQLDDTGRLAELRQELGKHHADLAMYRSEQGSWASDRLRGITEQLIRQKQGALDRERKKRYLQMAKPIEPPRVEIPTIHQMPLRYQGDDRKAYGYRVGLYWKLTREQFDTLPPEQQAEIRADIADIADSGHTKTIRNSLGQTVRGVTADHVESARVLRSRFGGDTATSSPAETTGAKKAAPVAVPAVAPGSVAKRGDLVIVEEHSRDFAGPRFRVGVVTSVASDGLVKSFRDARSSVDEKREHLGEHRFHVVSADKIDVEAALATARDNPWPNGDHKGKPFDSLKEVKTALGPHRKATPDAPAPAKAAKKATQPRATPDFDTRVSKAASGQAALRATRVQPPDDEAASAITTFALGGFTDTNTALRQAKGQPLTAEGGGQYARNLTEGIDRSMHPTRRDIVVTRGEADPEAVFAGREPVAGLTWVQYGFSSTSVGDPDRLGVTFASGPAGPGVRMRIFVPKGTRAMSTEFTAYRGAPGHLDPDEIVLDRGLTYRIVRDNGVDKDGVRRLDVEVVPTATPTVRTPPRTDIYALTEGLHSQVGESGHGWDRYRDEAQIRINAGESPAQVADWLDAESARLEREGAGDWRQGRNVSDMDTAGLLTALADRLRRQAAPAAAKKTTPAKATRNPAKALSEADFDELDRLDIDQRRVYEGLLAQGFTHDRALEKAVRTPAAKKAPAKKAVPATPTKKATPPKAPKPTPAETVAKLRAATSRDEAREALQGHTVAELRRVADLAGITTGGRTKAQIENDIVHHSIGLRLGLAAMEAGMAPTLPAKPKTAEVKLYREMGGRMPTLTPLSVDHDASTGTMSERPLKGKWNPSKTGRTGHVSYDAPDGVYEANDRYGTKYVIVEGGEARQVDLEEARRHLTGGPGKADAAAPAARQPAAPGKKVNTPGAPAGYDVRDTGEKSLDDLPVYDVYRDGEKIGTLRRVDRFVPTASSVGNVESGARRDKGFRFIPVGGSEGVHTFPTVSDALRDHDFRSPRTRGASGSATPGAESFDGKSRARWLADAKQLREDFGDDPRLDIPRGAPAHEIARRVGEVNTDIGARNSAAAMAMVDESRDPDRTPEGIAAARARRREAIDTASELAVARFRTEHEAKLRAEGIDAAAPAAPRTPTGDPSTTPALSTDPRVREVEIANRVRAAYRAVRGSSPREWVSLGDLRNELGESVNRHELDAVLLRMGSESGVTLVPEDNQKTLTPQDREAAIRLVGGELHFISIDDPSPRPLPTPAADPDRDVLTRIGAGGATAADFDPATLRRLDTANLIELHRREPYGAAAARATDTDLATNPAGVTVRLTPLGRTRLDHPNATAGEAARLTAARSRQRQERIDTTRGVAETLTEIDELAHNGASDRAIAHRMRSRNRDHTLPPGLADELAAAAGDRSRLDTVVDRVAAEHGLTRITAPAGGVESYDRRKHQPLGGSLRDGEPVVVVRAGYMAEVGGDSVQLHRGVVAQAPSPAKTAARTTNPTERIRALVAREQAGETVAVLPFYGTAGDGSGPEVLSQHWHRPFTVDGVTYPTTEHYMMAAKARLFGDDDALRRILATDSPVEAKRIGREVRNFDKDTWDAAAYDIVVAGNLAKFGQNADLRDYLLGTGDRVLVEASPRDVVWGVGRGRSDPDRLRPSQWRGRNQLGFALMDVRDQLRGQRAAAPVAPTPAKKATPRKAGRVATRDLTSGPDATTTATRVVAATREGGTNPGQRGPHGDELLHHIATEQGWTATPRQATTTELDTMVAAGRPELWRGTETSAEADRLVSGEPYYGDSVYGSGINTSENRVIARQYGDSLTRMTLAPDARVVDLADIQDQQTRFLDELPLGNPDARLVYADTSRFAAARGYDAIRIPTTTGPVSRDEAETIVADLPEGPNVYYHAARRTPTELDQKLATLSGDNPDGEIYLTDQPRDSLGYLESDPGNVYAVRLATTARIADTDQLREAADTALPGGRVGFFGYEPTDFELAEHPQVRRALAGQGFAGATFRDLAPDNAYQHNSTVVWDSAALTRVDHRQVPAVGDSDGGVDTDDPQFLDLVAGQLGLTAADLSPEEIAALRSGRGDHYLVLNRGALVVDRGPSPAKATPAAKKTTPGAPKARTHKKTPTPTPGQLAAHLRTTNHVDSPQLHDRVAAVLDHQAQLAPRVAMRLRRVDVAPTREPGDPRIWQPESSVEPHESSAVYVSEGERTADRRGGPAIRLHPNWLDPDGPDRLDTPTVYPPGLGVRGLEALLSHEYGHHVVSVINPDAIDDPRGVAGWTREHLDRLFIPLAQALGVPPPTSVTGDTPLPLARWRFTHRDAFAAQISGHAGALQGNILEVLAEIWNEWSIRGEDSRPVARRIGPILRDMAEAALTPP